MTPVHSRRRLLAGLAAFPTVSLVPRARAESDTDVVVIGAGAAGLAASQELRRRQLRVTTLEARNRIGGRAHTDHEVFGVPYDIGAHWLEGGNRNPFVRNPERHGFTIYPAPDDETVYIGSREATDAESEAYHRAVRRTLRAISAAGRQGRDVSPAEVVPDTGEWHDLVHFNIGAYEQGKDYDGFSCLDWWESEGGAESYCREGYGALLARSARDVPVHLSTPVTAVDWSGNGVIVSTESGSIRARACLVTASTGVLAAGAIRFNPALPVEKQESFAKISMGFYDHVALLLSENIFGTEADEYLFCNADTHGAQSPALAGFLTNVSGTRLTLADVGGNFARELELAGRGAAIDFVRGELRRLFGTGVDRHIVGADFVPWGLDPWTRGAYASAEPGAYPLRRVLREPVGDRIWFAGEACSAVSWATVHGAYRTGEDAAHEISRGLAGA